MRRNDVLGAVTQAEEIRYSGNRKRRLRSTSVGKPMVGLNDEE